MRRLKVFSLVFLALATPAACHACVKGDLVQDISDGVRLGYAIVKDDVRYEQDNYYVDDDGVSWGCICDVTQCLRKCCRYGEYPSKQGLDRVCKPSPTNQRERMAASVRENRHLGDYKIFHAGFICGTANSVIYGDLKKDLKGGRLEVLEMSLDERNFCVDFVRGKLTSIICVTTEAKKIVNSIGMVISMPFLLITFIVYALLPDRNLHMKALMCYVINLLLAYMFIVTIQLSDTVFPDDICAILGFGCIFFFLSSFFWMNVICIDIFLGFRGIRGGPGIRSSEWKRFLIYCIYAWGMSLLIVFITFMINTYVNPISIFHPGVAIGQCFIRDGLPMLLYFYGPMGILIISNVLLFALTALRIRKVKKDTAMLKHSGSKRHSDDEQQNFNLYFKLLLAMGVNWSMEIISWAVTLPQYFWYLSDICNALYGVIIFFIFVFKRNIWKQLKRRYYSFMGRHHMAHSMGTTNFTKTTNDSMTVSTNDRAMEESELNTSRMN